MEKVEAAILRRFAEKSAFDPDRMQSFLDTLDHLITSSGFRVTSKHVVTHHVLTDGKGVLTFSLAGHDTEESSNLSDGLDLVKVIALLDDANKFAHKERLAISLGVSKKARGSFSIEVVTL